MTDIASKRSIGPAFPNSEKFLSKHKDCSLVLQSITFGKHWSRRMKHGKIRLNGAQGASSRDVLSDATATKFLKNATATANPGAPLG
jgi:hypothetical protein